MIQQPLVEAHLSTRHPSGNNYSLMYRNYFNIYIYIVYELVSKYSKPQNCGWKWVIQIKLWEQYDKITKGPTVIQEETFSTISIVRKPFASNMKKWQLKRTWKIIILNVTYFIHWLSSQTRPVSTFWKNRTNHFWIYSFINLSPPKHSQYL